jgi:hypothetical protein
MKTPVSFLEFRFRFISIVLDANQSSRAQQKKEEKRKEAKEFVNTSAKY